MIDSIRKKFIEYSKKYDLTIPDIMRKFHHSFRVMEYSKEIAISLNLNDYDVDLCCIIGLLHDIARFSQWTEYETYDDKDSFDHGDMGYDILNDFLDDFSDKNIILTAVKNHNKLKIEDGLDERTLLFCKIIRDADKLDIMKEQNLIITENCDFIEEYIIKCFDEKRLFDNYFVDSNFNRILRQLLFIYDLNFKYSFDFVLKNNIIENKTNLLSIYSLELDKIKYIKDSLMEYVSDKT